MVEEHLGSDSSRVVRVAHGRTWAAGFEVSPRLVLTAAHAVGGVDSPVNVASLASLSSGRQYAARVVWRGYSVASGPPSQAKDRRGGVDAALVHIEAADWVTGTEAPVRWGRIVTEAEPVPCRAWGFPSSEHRTGEVAQVSGTISPGNGFLAGTYVIDCDTDRLRPPGGSPWEGMSGAAVLCGDLVAGVVSVDLPGHVPARLEAEPAVVLLREKSFRETLNLYGAPGRHMVEPVEYAALVHPDHISEPPAPVSLVELLLPDRRTVPFHGRVDELDALEAWSRRSGAGVCVLHAPGGRGKSRLALEFCRKLAEEEWAVLWPGSGCVDAIRGLSPPAVPLLVVIDGADTRTDDTAAVMELAARLRYARVKVLLLARSDTWWIDQVCHSPGASVAAVTLMSNALRLPLADLPTDADALASTYQDAVRAFAAALSAVPGWGHRSWRTLADGLAPPRRHDALGSPLTLHMTALVSLLNASISTNDSTAPPHGSETASVEKELLAFEQRHWLNVATQHPSLSGLSDRVRIDAVAAVVALGAEDHRQALTLLKQVPDLEDQSRDRRRSVCDWIQSVIPVTGGAFIGDLRPDRLAERFVGSRLQADPELADGFLPGATPAQAARFLTLLTRACARGVLDEEELVGWCVRHRDVLSLPAIHVATVVETPGPLLRALEAITDHEAITLPELERLAAHLPQSSYNLAPWALHLSRRIAQAHQAQAEIHPEQSARYAVALRELSRRLVHMGSYEEALHTAEQAIGVWRGLPAPHPQRLSEWGACHNNLALCLTHLGRRSEGLRAARTAVHALAMVEPAEDPTALARHSSALATLAEAERSLGNHGAAVRTAADSVALCRKLVDHDSDQYKSFLADALQNKAVYQLDAGLHADALKAVQEAVELHETLAEARPDAFRPALALALATLSSAFGLMGLRHEALEAARRAVAIRRALAEARPEVYLADLAGALNHLATDLVDLGLADEARDAIEESVHWFRQLANKHPETHGRGLALTLNTLANQLTSDGQHDRAVETAKESVKRYRQLAETHPAAAPSELSMALVTLAHTLDKADRPHEGLRYLKEAVAINRELNATDADAYGHDLAISLNNLASLLHRVDDSATALVFVDEAIALGNARQAEGSRAFADVLQKNWLVKYHCLADLGQYEEAAAAALEALNRLRALAREVPNLYENTLAAALAVTSVVLRGTGHGERALEHLGEAARIGRRLVDRDPDGHQGQLAEVLEARSDHLWLLGRGRESLKAAAEAVRNRRALHARRGDDVTALDSIRATLALGTRLMWCGHRADALRVTREALSALRPLHASDPDEHAALLSATLSQLQLLLFHAGEGDAAMDTGTEAVRIVRSVADAHRPNDMAPDRAMAGLRAVAAALTPHGIVIGELGRDEAVSVLGEAVALCRRLTDHGAVEDDIRLAEALGFYGRHLAAVPQRHPEALRATAEAVDLCRRHTGYLPLLSPQLALLLTIHGLRLAEAGHAAEAVARTDEALELARSLATDDRRAHRDLLAHALAAVARARLLIGDRSAHVRDAAKESVALFQEIARDEPAATLPYLRQAQDTDDRLRQCQQSYVR